MYTGCVCERSVVVADSDVLREIVGLDTANKIVRSAMLKQVGAHGRVSFARSNVATPSGTA
jgi:hypothetical protein